MFDGLRKAFNRAMARHENKRFLEATMAACAIVANADGVVSFAERGRLDQIIEFVDRLKIYEPHDAVNLFNEYVDLLNEDERQTDILYEMIRKAILHEDDKRLLIQICLKICDADGSITASERNVIEELAANIDASL